jgi:hypothetical protein
MDYKTDGQEGSRQIIHAILMLFIGNQRDSQLVCHLEKVGGFKTGKLTFLSQIPHLTCFAIRAGCRKLLVPLKHHLSW